MRLLSETAAKITGVLLLGLFVFSAHGLSGIRHYETLSYDPAYLQQQHNELRDKRSLSTTIRLQINAYNRTFTTDMSTSNEVFAPGVKFVMGNGEPVPYDPLTFYQGVLVDDNKSSVKGHVINGVFDGIIHAHGEEYHIEKAHKFFSTDQDFHSIIYRASDVEEPASICGARDKVYDELHKLQSTGGTSQRDRIMYGSSRRTKRQANAPQFCPVLVAADDRFRNVVGRGDPATTTSEIVNVISEVQAIFAGTDFGVGYMVQPTIARVQILDENAPGYRFGAANIDVNSFLDLWSQEDHSQFCLALLLTNRDFAGGVLGLAWVAEPAGGNRGGICEQSPVRLQTGQRYLNTAIVTFINFGRQQPRSVSIVTIAHEFGHNFGSPHDPMSGSCAPGGGAGNFIMFPSATDGQQTNNKMFSTCSLGSIRPVLQTKSSCFEADRFFCGNGIQEDGEECDCGSPSECASDPCCTPDCMLTPGSDCSPSGANPCCTETCQFKSAAVECLPETECGFAVNCTGTMSACDSPTPRSDSVTCNNGMNLCREGVCSGSICLVMGYMDCECTAPNQECHVCCIDRADMMTCRTSFDLFSETMGGQLRPAGHTCEDREGFCDSNGQCVVINNQDVLDDLLDLLTIDTLNAIVRWLSVYWYIPVAVVVGIGILIVLLHITYRRKLKKPLKRRINSMRRSVRGESDRGRGVSEAQTGGVGGVDRSDGAQRRRGGAPRQISQREALNRLCHFFPTADREVVQAVMLQCSSESKAVKKLLDQGFPLKKVPIPRA